MSDFEVSEHVDVRRHGRRQTRYEEFGSSGSNEILTDLSSSKLAGGQSPVIVIACQVINPVCFYGRASIVSTVSFTVSQLGMAVGVHLKD